MPAPIHGQSGTGLGGPLSAISHLRALGMTIDIDATMAERICARLLQIDGKYRNGEFNERRPASQPHDRYSFAFGPQSIKHFYAAFDAIAEWIVDGSAAEMTIEQMVPNMIHQYHLQAQWLPLRTPRETFDLLLGSIRKWKGINLEKKLEMRSAEPPSGKTPGLNRGSADHAARSRDEVRDERTRLLDAYKRQCIEAGVKVTDAMIAKAACPSWNHRTPVTRWKGNDPRCSSTHDSMIRAVFKSKPHLSKK